MLTKSEQKRVAAAYVLQADLLNLSNVEELPEDVKRKARDTALKMIRDERQARTAKAQRTKAHRAAEEAFTWQPVRRR